MTGLGNEVTGCTEGLRYSLELDQMVRDEGQTLVAAVADEIVILLAHAAKSRHVDARLDSRYRPRLIRRLVSRADERQLMDIEAE